MDNIRPEEATTRQHDLASPSAVGPDDAFRKRSGGHSQATAGDRPTQEYSHPTGHVASLMGNDDEIERQFRRASPYNLR